MQEEYLKVEISKVNLKLNSSWQKLIISDFDEGAEALKQAVDNINEIVDYCMKNNIKISLDSRRISNLLHKINQCFKKHQYIEAADIIKYKMVKIVNSIS